MLQVLVLQELRNPDGPALIVVIFYEILLSDNSNHNDQLSRPPYSFLFKRNYF